MGFQTAPHLGAVVLFEAPHRIIQTLEELADLQPDRQAVVCRELTKMHEEVKKDSLRELATWAQKGLKGEIVIVLDRLEQESTLQDRMRSMTRLKNA